MKNVFIVGIVIVVYFSAYIYNVKYICGYISIGKNKNQPRKRRKKNLLKKPFGKKILKWNSNTLQFNVFRAFDRESVDVCALDICSVLLCPVVSLSLPLFVEFLFRHFSGRINDLWCQIQVNRVRLTDNNYLMSFCMSLNCQYEQDRYKTTKKPTNHQTDTHTRIRIWTIKIDIKKKENKCEVVCCVYTICSLMK